MSAQRIVVVAFQRISPFHLSVPCVVFGEACPGVPPWHFQVCSAEAGPLRTQIGLTIEVAAGLEALSTADTIIVPSWRDPAERPPAELLHALQAAQQRGAQLVGLCLGAYVLAEAGLLNGRRATTHWAYAQDFARRYPQVRFDPHVLYVDDGAIVTSAGTAAGLDCCLHLIRQGYGAQLANSVARRLVIPPQRSGGQAQYIEQPIPVRAQDSRLAELIPWLLAHLHDSHSLESVAARAVMSRRSFSRHFRQLTGQALGPWLLAQRLALCQRLLESSGHSMAHIATLTGLGSPESLRSHFRRQFGISPSAWRAVYQDGKADGHEC